MQNNRTIVDAMFHSAEELKQNKEYEKAIEVYNEVLKAEQFEEAFSSKCLLSISLCYGCLNNEEQCKEYLMRWRNKHKNQKLGTVEEELLNNIDLELDRVIASQGEDLIAKEMETKLDEEP